MILMLCSALTWFKEVITPRSDFSMPRNSFWLWLILPLTFLAWWAPVKVVPAGFVPEFTLYNLIYNGSGLTYCMVTPMILGFLLLYGGGIDKTYPFNPIKLFSFLLE